MTAELAVRQDSPAVIDLVQVAPQVYAPAGQMVPYRPNLPAVVIYPVPQQTYADDAWAQRRDEAVLVVSGTLAYAVPCGLLIHWWGWVGAVPALALYAVGVRAVRTWLR